MGLGPVIFEIVCNTNKPLVRDGMFRFDAEGHRRLRFCAAIAGIRPFDFKIVAVNTRNVIGILNDERPVHPAPEIGNVEGVDTLALDCRRRGPDRQSVAPRIETRNDRKSDEGQAQEDEPVPGLDERKKAEDCPQNGCQGGEGLKTDLHAGSVPAPADASTPSGCG